MKKKKWLLWFLPVFVLGIGVVAYLFRPTPKCVCNKSSVCEVSAKELVAQYENDEGKANTHFLGKVITVEGAVSATHFDDNGFLIVELESQGSGVASCTFCDKDISKDQVKIGSTVRIKGECVGYTFDVVLVKCCLE